MVLPATAQVTRPQLSISTTGSYDGPTSPQRAATFIPRKQQVQAERASPSSLLDKLNIAQQAQYARALGVDPELEPELFEFVQLMLKMHVPHPWRECLDPKRRIYYFNEQTNVSSWSHPLIQTHILLSSAFRRVVVARDRVGAACKELEAMRKQGEAELSLWREVSHDGSRLYYYHTQTQETRWENPREILTAELAMQAQMLSHLIRGADQNLPYEEPRSKIGTSSPIAGQSPTFSQGRQFAPSPRPKPQKVKIAEDEEFMRAEAFSNVRSELDMFTKALTSSPSPVADAAPRIEPASAAAMQDKYHLMAALHIQGFYRRRRDLKKLTEFILARNLEKRRRRVAANRIRLKFRCFWKRKRQKALVLIQSACRSVVAQLILQKLGLEAIRKARVEAYLNHLRETSAATYIQAWIRGRNERLKLIRLKDSASVVGLLWRCHQAREQVQRLKVNRCRTKIAAKLIQRHWRDLKMQKEAHLLKVQKFTDETAARRIQRCWHKLTHLQEVAASKIQNRWRKKLAHQEVINRQKEKQCLEEAVVRIQSLIRQRVAVAKRKELLQKKAAAIRLQTAQRGLIARKEVARLRDLRVTKVVREEAAVKIQCLARCVLARFLFEEKKRKSLAKSKCAFRVIFDESVGGTKIGAPGTNLGLRLEADSKEVNFISLSGMIASWNRQKQAHAIRIGDEVITVNGKHALSEINQELTEAEKLEIIVERKGNNRQLKLCIDRQRGIAFGVDANSLGLNFGKDSMLVDRIADFSAIADWNELNAPKAVTVGDRLLGVNGHFDTRTIKEAVASGYILELVFLGKHPYELPVDEAASVASSFEDLESIEHRWTVLRSELSQLKGSSDKDRLLQVKQELSVITDELRDVLSHIDEELQQRDEDLALVRASDARNAKLAAEELRLTLRIDDLRRRKAGLLEEFGSLATVGSLPETPMEGASSLPPRPDFAPRWEGVDSQLWGPSNKGGPASPTEATAVAVPKPELSLASADEFIQGLARATTGFERFLEAAKDNMPPAGRKGRERLDYASLGAGNSKKWRRREKGTTDEDEDTTDLDETSELQLLHGSSTEHTPRGGIRPVVRFAKQDEEDDDDLGPEAIVHRPVRPLLRRLSAGSSESLSKAPSETPSSSSKSREPDSKGRSKPYEFRILLDKTYGSELGIDANFSEVGSILLESIGEGLVGSWNASNAHRPVLVGDRIVEVNGIRGNTKKMIEEIKSAQVLSIRLQREEALTVRDAEPVRNHSSRESLDPQRGLSRGSQRRGPRSGSARRQRRDASVSSESSYKVLQKNVEKAKELKKVLIQQGNHAVYTAYSHIFDQMLPPSAPSQPKKQPSSDRLPPEFDHLKNVASNLQPKVASSASMPSLEALQSSAASCRAQRQALGGRSLLAKAGASSILRSAPNLHQHV